MAEKKQATKSFTVSTGEIKTQWDEIIFQRLQVYCHRMRINLQAISLNSRLFMKFTGNEYQLSELEDYLKKKEKEQ